MYVQTNVHPSSLSPQDLRELNHITGHGGTKIGARRQLDALLSKTSHDMPSSQRPCIEVSTGGHFIGCALIGAK